MNYRSPTVKRLMRDMDISEDQAKTVRGLIKGTIEPESIGACKDWIRQCYHRPSDDELLMCAIDATLETFGVEAIWRNDCQDDGILGVYCNTGNSYGATICQRHDSWLGWRAPYIGCWASLVGE